MDSGEGIRILYDWNEKANYEIPPFVLIFSACTHHVCTAIAVCTFFIHSTLRLRLMFLFWFLKSLEIVHSHGRFYEVHMASSFMYVAV